MCIFFAIIIFLHALFFFLFSPGILFTIPSKSNKYTIAFVHSILFGILVTFTHILFWNICMKKHKHKQEEDFTVKTPYDFRPR